MSYLLKVECINDNWGLPPEALVFVPLVNGGKKPKQNYWVAEILGEDKKYKYKRKFESYKKDYTYANSNGTRGVYAYYNLENDKVYEVNHQISWGRNERFFCKIKNNEMIKINESEVKKWVKNI